MAALREAIERNKSHNCNCSNSNNMHSCWITTSTLATNIRLGRKLFNTDNTHTHTNTPTHPHTHTHTDTWLRELLMWEHFLFVHAQEMIFAQFVSMSWKSLAALQKAIKCSRSHDCNRSNSNNMHSYGITIHTMATNIRLGGKLVNTDNTHTHTNTHKHTHTHTVRHMVKRIIYVGELFYMCMPKKWFLLSLS